jgi:inosine triphosphate pyrophosphatase
MLQGFSSTEATALCTFAYCEPGKEPILFEGATEGNIVPARGPTNFGWDPIFEVSGTGMTLVTSSMDLGATWFLSTDFVFSLF